MSRSSPPPRSLALAAYGAAMTTLAPLATLVLAQRAGRGKEDPARRHERLGRPRIPRPTGPLAWLHGASVGETLSLLPLIKALATARPDLALLVTSGTVTSAELMARRLPAGAIHQFAPLDIPAVTRRFLDHWRPDLAVFVESELWPSALTQAKRRGVRLALLGARLSQASARGWGRAPAAARALLGGFDLILAQDAASRTRIESLGGVVAGLLDLKLAGAPLPCDAGELERLTALIGARSVIVAASTHPGEDEIVAGAVQALGLPDALLILAPRHPQRGPAIAQALRASGLRLAQRSVGEALTPQTQVYLADTLGELGLLFRLGLIAVVGGSLTGGIGGHNPLEPARLGLGSLTGPDIANFRQAYGGLIAAGGAQITADQAALTAALRDLLSTPDQARAMGERARVFAARGDGALTGALDALAPFLPKAAP